MNDLCDQCFHFFAPDDKCMRGDTQIAIDRPVLSCRTFTDISGPCALCGRSLAEDGRESIRCLNGSSANPWPLRSPDVLVCPDCQDKAIKAAIESVASVTHEVVCRLEMPERKDATCDLFADARGHGICVEEVESALKELSDAGMTGDHGPVALRRLIASIVEPTDVAKDAFAQFGIEWGPDAVSGRSLRKTVNKIANTWPPLHAEPDVIPSLRAMMAIKVLGKECLWRGYDLSDPDRAPAEDPADPTLLHEKTRKMLDGIVHRLSVLESWRDGQHVGSPEHSLNKRVNEEQHKRAQDDRELRNEIAGMRKRLDEDRKVLRAAVGEMNKIFRDAKPPTLFYHHDTDPSEPESFPDPDMVGEDEF